MWELVEYCIIIIKLEGTLHVPNTIRNMTAMFEFYNLLPLAVSTAPLSVMVPPTKMWWWEIPYISTAFYEESLRWRFQIWLAFPPIGGTHGYVLDRAASARDGSQQARSYRARTPARERWKNVLWNDVITRNPETCESAPPHEHGLASFGFAGARRPQRIDKKLLNERTFAMTSSCGAPAGTSQIIFRLFLSQIGARMMRMRRRL